MLTTYLTQCANPRKDFWHIRGIIGRGESGMRGESGSRLGAGEPLCTLWPLLGLSTPIGGRLLWLLTPLHPPWGLPPPLAAEPPLQTIPSQPSHAPPITEALDSKTDQPHCKMHIAYMLMSQAAEYDYSNPDSLS